ncbi:MAG: hypothetical protein IKY44_05290 [Clostridia bacterium]|nr:hypothetical protein [Clostridia bacterium]
MGEFTVSFFGRRYIPDPNFIENKLYKIIKELISSKKQIAFLVGRNCDFDIIVSRTINRAKEELSHAKTIHNCILTHQKETYLDDNSEFHYHLADRDIAYSSVEILATDIIQERNAEMVRRSDLCIFYVFEGDEIASDAMKHAIAQNKRIINIADFQPPDNQTISWTIS